MPSVFGFQNPLRPTCRICGAKQNSATPTKTCRYKCVSSPELVWNGRTRYLKVKKYAAVQFFARCREK